MDEKQDAIRTAYRELYDVLKKAYWSALTDEEGTRIRELYERVYALVSDLNEEDIASRTEEYAEVTKKIESTSEDLKKLSNEIASIVNDTKVATNVVNGIAKVLGAAAGFLGK